MIARFERSGLAWPVPVEMNDTALEARLYGAAGVKPGRRKLPEPDWSVVAREMKRKHVTMLWHHTMPVDGGIHINSSTPISSVNRRHPYARTANDRSPSHTMTKNRQSNAREALFKSVSPESNHCFNSRFLAAWRLNQSFPSPDRACV